MLGDRVRAHAAPCLRLLRLLRHAGAIGGVHALSAELAGSVRSQTTNSPASVAPTMLGRIACDVPALQLA